MSSIEFTIESIQAHLAKKLSANTANKTTVSDIEINNLQRLREDIQMQISLFIPKGFQWHDIQKYSLEEQKKIWTTRELILAYFLIYLLKAQTSGLIKRQAPPGFDITDYTLNMFGSNKPTSDIDISVEGPKASYLIAIFEDTWVEVIGSPPGQLDIELYGDFLMVMDDTNKPAFLNSREFNDSATEILPYVGASILRNTSTLDFQLLNQFIVNYPEVPELQNAQWKINAEKLISEAGAYNSTGYREAYYKLLGEAEDLKVAALNSNETQKQRHLKIFLLLCKANIYRSENYILPSTVIYVVRDIQAKSPGAEKSQCSPYHARLASCALGPFTYLCSAMEQIGYMERFAYDPSKVEKYRARLESSMYKYDSLKQRGGRRRYLQGRQTRKQSHKKQKRTNRKLRRN